MEEQQPTSENIDKNSEEGIDITPKKDGGVIKIIKREGAHEFGRPVTGDNVSVHYVGTLTDGTKFDSSRDRGEYFQFKIGKGEVIKAWDIGVSTMHKGELAVLTCKPEYAYGAAGAGEAIPPNATLIFEVELFDWKGEDLSPDKDGGILRSTLDNGKGYTSPDDGATCEVHILGRYNGREFENRDVKFVIGEGTEQGIVEGIELAVKKFKEGEISVLKIHAKYTYGAAGNAEFNIPSGANLEYEVKLKSFEKAKEAWEMDPEEKLEQSVIIKQKGTDFFKKEKYQLALRYYKKIIDFLESEDKLEGEQAEKRKNLMLAGHLNSAMCSLKLEDNFEAISYCDKVLELEPNNEKGLFRRGTAHMNIHDYTEAKVDFQRVLEIDPNNKAAQNQITVANAKIKQIQDKEKKTYAGMFQKFAVADAKREKESIKVDGTSPKHEAMQENGTSSEEPSDGAPVETSVGDGATKEGKTDANSTNKVTESAEMEVSA